MIINILQIYIDILAYFRLKSSPSNLYPSPRLTITHIPMDLLELFRILGMDGDQNIGIDRFDRILEVAFAAAWPERAIVQELLAQIPWYHHIALMEKLKDPAEAPPGKKPLRIFLKYAIFLIQENIRKQENDYRKRYN